MSTIYNIAIFITNQVTADPGASAMFGPVSKPIGGHVLAHASTVRILLKKGRGEQRIAKIYDSPDVKSSPSLPLLLALLFHGRLLLVHV